jgi:hypothetical protein
MKIRILFGIIFSVVVMALTGCGGDGGGGTPPTTVLMKVSSTGLATGAKIGSIDVTVTLPEGVTVNRDPATNITKDVAVSGVAAVVTAPNIMTLSTINGQALRAIVVNAQGFVAGEFMQITCTVPAGVTAGKTADIKAAVAAATFVATDPNGATLSGIKLTASE